MRECQGAALHGSPKGSEQGRALADTSQTGCGQNTKGFTVAGAAAGHAETSALFAFACNCTMSTGTGVTIANPIQINIHVSSSQSMTKTQKAATIRIQPPCDEGSKDQVRSYFGSFEASTLSGIESWILALAPVHTGTTATSCTSDPRFQDRCELGPLQLAGLAGNSPSQARSCASQENPSHTSTPVQRKRGRSHQKQRGRGRLRDRRTDNRRDNLDDIRDPEAPDEIVTIPVGTPPLQRNGQTASSGAMVFATKRRHSQCPERSNMAGQLLFACQEPLFSLRPHCTPLITCPCLLLLLLLASLHLNVKTGLTGLH